MLFLSHVFITTGRKRQKMEGTTYEKKPGAHQAPIYAKTQEDTAHASSVCGSRQGCAAPPPAASGRFWADAAKLDVGGSPRAQWARGPRLDGAGFGQATAFNVYGVSGPQEKGRTRCSSDVLGFSFKPEFLKLRRAPPQTPRSSHRGGGAGICWGWGSGRRSNQKPARPPPWVAGLGRKGGAGAAAPAGGRGEGARPEG